MLKIPFHRRVLPWVFVLIFLFMAPAVVFYTAGYRWNSKKGIVERNGTLILDTAPRGSDIELNGQGYAEKTPATLQNIAPGSYLIRLTLNGYHDWQKTLSVEPERVTFANSVRLWLKNEPRKINDQETLKLMTNQNQDLVILQVKNHDNFEIGVLDLKNESISKIKLPQMLNPTFMDWSPDGLNVFLISETNGETSQWLLQTDPLGIIKLPQGIYHWEKSHLKGFTEKDELQIAANGAVSRQPKVENVQDQLGDAILRFVDDNKNLILLNDASAQEGLILPNGEWQFRQENRDDLLLQSNDQWLRLFIKDQPNTSIRAYGDQIFPLNIKREMHYLILNNNEVYIWAPYLEPELLYRHSEAIIAAGWHMDGDNVFIATKNEVIMFELDPRDGRRQTVLTNFTEIKSAVIANDTIYVSGTYQEQSGLWALKIAER